MRKDILSAIAREKNHQDNKYGPWEERGLDFDKAIGILSDEVNEVFFAKTHEEELREMMQVLTVALRIVETFGVLEREDWHE